MSELLENAISCASNAISAWCRYITANDTGSNGSHQAGFYVPKKAASLLFEDACNKGKNRTKDVKISWQGDFSTDSRFIYYGQKTRNEYRITRFGKQFPFLEDDCVGSLLIIAKMSESEYSAFVLSSDEDIDGFFEYFSLAPGQSSYLINETISTEEAMTTLFEAFASEHKDFPDTKTMSAGARDCYGKIYRSASDSALKNPDSLLINWVDTEYKLFRYLEKTDFGIRSFDDVNKFIDTANKFLNRRKSRAGKSLENHLCEIFTKNNLKFESQAITEDKKKPDFLFPDSEHYHNFEFPSKYLTMLGAKTTCKDRWRQILNEANRIDIKYIFTLQQGISKNQMKEMKESHVIVVVPQEYISCFPKEYREDIKNLKDFIQIVKEKQNNIKKSFNIMNI